MQYGLNKHDFKIISSILSKQGNVQNALLFGSRATNTHRINSDIDIALKPKNGNFSIVEIANLKAAFDESSLVYFVDLVSYKSADESLKKHIDKEGKVIFG